MRAECGRNHQGACAWVARRDGEGGACLQPESRRFRVDFIRHGYDDWIVLETRADAEAFVAWGETNGSAFIDAKIGEVDA